MVITMKKVYDYDLNKEADSINNFEIVFNIDSIEQLSEITPLMFDRAADGKLVTNRYRSIEEAVRLSVAKCIVDYDTQHITIEFIPERLLKKINVNCNFSARDILGKIHELKYHTDSITIKEYTSRGVSLKSDTFYFLSNDSFTWSYSLKCEEE